jgi:hypothetical protein
VVFAAANDICGAEHSAPHTECERATETDRRTETQPGSNEIEIMQPAAAVDTRAPESANIMANIIALSRLLPLGACAKCSARGANHVHVGSLVLQLRAWVRFICRWQRMGRGCE